MSVPLLSQQLLLILRSQYTFFDQKSKDSIRLAQFLRFCTNPAPNVDANGRPVMVAGTHFDVIAQPRMSKDSGHPTRDFFVELRADGDSAEAPSRSW